MTERYQAECACDSPEHTFRFMQDEDNNVYLEVHLVTLPFWRRLKAAVRYLFGHRSVFGCFDNMVLREEDVEGIKVFLQGVQNDIAQARSPGVPQEEWVERPLRLVPSDGEEKHSPPEPGAPEV